MPELPEVQTTASGLDRAVSGSVIRDVWTDYRSAFHAGKDSIKDPAYFARFRARVKGKEITHVSRRAKNVLIHLSSGDVILVHMKMTGHILCGRFVFDRSKKKDPWTPAPDERAAFHDPFNRFIHFVMTLTSGRGHKKISGLAKPARPARTIQLALSDMRKFAKVTLISEKHLEEGAEQSDHIAGLGPEPLEKGFTFQVFKDRLGRRPNGRIKTVLMDQTAIAGVGNIYSDEALWRAGLHPEERVRNIPDRLLKKLYIAVLAVLRKGIDFGGDSMSDYRNINGERGKFQEKHQAYRKTGQRCSLKLAGARGGTRCPGIIVRKIVGGRSAHFCSIHQKLLVK